MIVDENYTRCVQRLIQSVLPRGRQVRDRKHVCSRAIRMHDRMCMHVNDVQVCAYDYRPVSMAPSPAPSRFWYFCEISSSITQNYENEINVASPSDKAQRRGRWCSSHLFGIIANFSRYYILYFVKWHYDAGISVNRRMGDDGYNTGVKKIFANSKEDGNVWTLNCNRACFPPRVKFWKGDTYTMLIN